MHKSFYVKKYFASKVTSNFLLRVSNTEKELKSRILEIANKLTHFKFLCVILSYKKFMKKVLIGLSLELNFLSPTVKECIES